MSLPTWMGSRSSPCYSAHPATVPGQAPRVLAHAHFHRIAAMRSSKGMTGRWQPSLLVFHGYHDRHRPHDSGFCLTCRIDFHPGAMSPSLGEIRWIDIKKVKGISVCETQTSRLSRRRKANTAQADAPNPPDKPNGQKGRTTGRPYEGGINKALRRGHCQDINSMVANQGLEPRTCGL